MTNTPTIRLTARRRSGHAVVHVHRAGRPSRRYRVSLARYKQLRERAFDWICLAAGSARRPPLPGLRTSGHWGHCDFMLNVWLVEEQAAASVTTDVLLQEATRRNGQCLLSHQDAAALLSVEHCRISPKLTVRHQGQEYDVSGVPGVLVGETIQLDLNNLPPRFSQDHFPLSALPLLAPGSCHADAENRSAGYPQASRAPEARPDERADGAQSLRHVSGAAPEPVADPAHQRHEACALAPGRHGQAPQSVQPVHQSPVRSWPCVCPRS